MKQGVPDSFFGASERGNIRPQAEKQPVHTIVIDVEGRDCLEFYYSGFNGGKRDKIKGSCYIEKLYHGIVTWEGKEVLGNFKLKIRGSGLDKIGLELSKGTLPCLHNGVIDGFAAEVVVSSITLEPYWPEKLEPPEA